MLATSRTQVPSRRVHRTHRVARSQRNGPDDLLRGSGCSLTGQPRRVVGFAGGPKQALARLCPCEPVTLHGRRLAAQHERPTSEVQRLSELQDHGSAVLDRFPAGRTSGIIGEGVGGQSRGGHGGWLPPPLLVPRENMTASRAWGRSQSSLNSVTIHRAVWCSWVPLSACQ